MAPLRLCAFEVLHGAAIGAIIPVVRQHHPSLPLTVFAQGQLEAHLLARCRADAGDRAASFWEIGFFFFF